MSERDSYAPGLPCWIDLGSPDVEASAAFYSGLFGWNYEEGPPEAGGYRNAILKGRRVAGLGPAQSEGPPWWTTYFCVSDPDATAAAVESNGGTILEKPTDAMGFGTFSVFTDPGGAKFSTWKPGSHPGAGLRDEHGTFSWCELMTRDIAGARQFYGAVLGWTFEEYPMGEGTPYTVFNVGDVNAGGGVDLNGPEFPPEVPPNWTVYFEVDDTDLTAAKVSELGGSVMMPPTDIPEVGRFAICNGSQGEAFAIIHSTGPSSS